MQRLFVFGFPELYGGAGTELYHQILIWQFMGMEVHLIPPWRVERNPLYPEMLARGVHIHPVNDYSSLTEEDPIFSFCNGEFLELLPQIRTYTKKTVFVNCMSWLFPQEKEAMRKGEIAMFLYQNERVMQENKIKLKAFNKNPKIQFKKFIPYFHREDFPFIEKRRNEYFGCGRISRQEADKFAKDTLFIYESFVSPIPKRGLFLGFGKRSEEKTGPPPPWIRTALNQEEVSQQEFYQHCEIILQPSNTVENWPRIGFEAMSSGSVLIVDNAGGWQQMIEHGKTGWLCNNERDFIYYASKMAYEPNQRYDMAAAARERGLLLSNKEFSLESWKEIFTVLNNMDI